MDPWYLTGLVEGAGSFTFSRQSGSSLALYFAIRLREDDEPVLHEIQSVLGGIGRIYRPPSGGCYFRVNRRADLERVCEHFTRFPLQGRKQRAFAIWRELAELKIRYHRRKPPPRVHELVDRLTRSLGAV